MRKSICFVLFLVIFVAAPVWGNAGQYDFRKTRWGMSKEEVKKSENQTVKYQTDDDLHYPSKLLHKEFTLIYKFNKNKLVSASYLLHKPISKINHINTYFALLDALEKKYGEPKKEGFVWKNKNNRIKVEELTKNDTQNVLDEIVSGNLEIEADWETCSSKIVIKCTKYFTGNEIAIIIMYNRKKTFTGAHEDKEQGLADKL